MCIQAICDVPAKQAEHLDRVSIPVLKHKYSYDPLLGIRSILYNSIKMIETSAVL